ncbi:MAG: primase-like DNA-binding domain-containing protein, partial [Planctomycetota bacterium]
MPFEKSYPEHLQNPNLADELSAELPGIFNWAYDGLQTLQRAGRFEVPQKCERARRQYRRDVNPARAFLLDNYVARPEYEGLPSREVYGCYVRFCKANGYRPMNNTNFGKEVKRAFPSVKKGQSRTGARRV